MSAQGDTRPEETDALTLVSLLGRMQYEIQTGFASTPRVMAEKLTVRERKTFARLMAKMLR